MAETGVSSPLTNDNHHHHQNDQNHNNINNPNVISTPPVAREISAPSSTSSSLSSTPSSAGVSLLLRNINGGENDPSSSPSSQHVVTLPSSPSSSVIGGLAANNNNNNNKVTFSTQLHKAISDILPSADPLDSPTFNPIEYINNMFPNEQSLVEIDTAISKVKTKMARVDNDVLASIRGQSRGGSVRGTEDLVDAKRQIEALFGKIRDIRSKAEHSERMVVEICRDIKSLDSAKKNLTTSITALKRLHMLVTGVDQLRGMLANRQYKPAGNLLQAVQQLAQGFNVQAARGVPKINQLNWSMQQIKEELVQQIHEEFIRSFETNQIPLGTLKDTCFVVDAMGPEAVKEFARWFADALLKEYQTIFAASNSDNSRLEHAEKRYQWLIRQWRQLEDLYPGVFPPAWHVQETFVEEFCVATRLAYSAMLEQSKTSLDVKDLIRTLTKTIEFETEVSKKFQEKEQAEGVVYEESNSGNNGAGDENEEEDEDAGLDSLNHNKSSLDAGDDPEQQQQQDGISSPHSADAIRARWKKHLAEKERTKRASKSASALGPKVPPPSKRFRGIISTCFDPYMDLYIEQEDRNLGAMLEKVMEEETWTVEDDTANKILASATDLVSYFIEALKRCTLLTRGQPLYDLFLLFKKYLTRYASFLQQKIPGYEGRSLAEPEARTVCLIVNTADYCSNLTVQMTDTLRKKIDAKFLDRIDLKTEQQEFSSIIAKGVTTLSGCLEAKLDPSLHAMSKMPWGSMDNAETVGDTSEYVTQMASAINSTVPIYHMWLSLPHFKFFCDLFAGSFIPRLTQHIYKCRRISEGKVPHLLLDIVALKQVLLNIPTVGATSSSSASQMPSSSSSNSLLTMSGGAASSLKGKKDGALVKDRYTRMVGREIGKAEALLKVIGSPNEVLVDTYKALVPSNDRSESDFLKILDLKWIKGTERQELTDRYLNQSKSSSSSSSSSSSGILSSSSIAGALVGENSSSSLSSSGSTTPNAAPSSPLTMPERRANIVAKTKDFQRLLSDVFKKEKERDKE
eukprot:TRINITY_DN1995_c0_g1_i3.p1 TRINITY_DN1995_c0_g1~~TRINITY_DN1995_c0_g1_i3.p1  ORF type:complete len:1025 (-),score=255.52 TRINITY_DN1995_c0_g1_i3:12-3086(-)